MLWLKFFLIQNVSYKFFVFPFVSDCDHEYKTQENRNQTGMKNVTHKRK